MRQFLCIVLAFSIIQTQAYNRAFAHDEESFLEQGERAYQSKNFTEAEETWRRGVKRYENDIEKKGLYLESLHRLGSFYVENKRFGDAVEVLDQARAVEKVPSNVSTIRLLEADLLLGRAYIGLDRFDEAEKILSQSYDKWLEKVPAKHELKKTLVNLLARVCLKNSKDVQSISRAQTLYKSLLEQEVSEHGGGSTETIEPLFALARATMIGGNTIEGESLARKAILLSEEKNGPQAEQTRRLKAELGVEFLNQKRYQEAKQLLEAYLQSPVRESESDRTLEVLYLLAEIDLVKLKDYADARLKLELARKLIQLKKSVSYQSTEMFSLLSVVYHRQGHAELARAQALEALDLWSALIRSEELSFEDKERCDKLIENLKSIFSQDDVVMHKILVSEARYRDGGDTDKLETALAMQKRFANANDALLFDSTFELAALHGNFQKADNYYKEAIEIRRRLSGDDIFLALLFEKAAVLHEQFYRLHSAIELMEKSIKIRLALGGAPSPGTVESLCKLGLLKLRVGDNDGARNAFQQSRLLSDKCDEACKSLIERNVALLEEASIVLEEPVPGNEQSARDVPSVLSTRAKSPHVNRPQLIAQLGHTDQISHLCFSNDGRLIATASSDRDVKLWDASSFHLLYTFSLHKAEITGLTFDATGTLLASSSKDSSVKVWETKSGRLVCDFKGIGGWYETADRGVMEAPAVITSFTHDGRYLITDIGDYRVRDTLQSCKLLDLRTAKAAKLEWRFGAKKGELGAGAPEFERLNIKHLTGASSADLVAGEIDSVKNGVERANVAVWNSSTGALNWHAPLPEGEDFQICFSRDGKTVIAVSNSKLKQWSAVDGSELRSWSLKLSSFQNDEEESYSEDSGPEMSVIVSANNKFLVATKRYGSEIIEIDSGKEISLPSTTVSMDAGDHLYALTTNDAGSEVQIYDLRTGTVSGTFSSDLILSEIAAAPKGDIAVGVSEDSSTLQIFDRTNGSSSVVKVSSVKSPKRPNDESTNNSLLRFSPDGGKIVFGFGNSLELWNTNAWNRMWKLSSGDGPSSAQFSNDGRYLAVARGKLTEVWNVATGILEKRFPSESKVVFVGFSPNDRILAVGGESLEFFDMLTSRRLQGAEVPCDLDSQGVFDKSGRYLTVGQSAWDLVTREEIGYSTKNTGYFGFSSCAFLSPTRLLLLGERPFIWDLESRQLYSDPDFDKDTRHTAISPNLDYIAVENRMGVAIKRIEESARSTHLLESGSQGEEFASFINSEDAIGIDVKSEFSDYFRPIQTMSFSRDGQRLACGLSDNSIRIYQSETGKILSELKGHTGSVVSVCFSPRNRDLIASASNDGTVRIWNASSGEEIVAICSFEDDWVVVEPTGRFDSSNLDNLPSLYWKFKKGEQESYTMPLESFMQRYYTPNLLSRALNHDLSPVGRIADLNLVLPTVRIDSVKPIDNDFVEVKVMYKSNTDIDRNTEQRKRSGVFNLRLFRDGSLVSYLPLEGSLSSGRADLTKDDEEHTQTFRVRLTKAASDKVKFTAYAFNDTRVKSVTSSYDFPLDSGRVRAEKKRRVFVIAVGVNQYSDPDWDLKYAAADARAYKENFADRIKKSGEFDVVYLPLISARDRSLDELEATKENIRDVLIGLSKRPQRKEISDFFKEHDATPVEPDDVIFLTFSCHGANTPEGEFFLFPSNIGESQNQELSDELKQLGISAFELTEWIKDIDSTDMTMIIDACHSASVAGKGYAGGPMDSPGMGQLAYYKRMRILSASQAQETAAENSTLGHGLLTFALLKEGLEPDSPADVSPKDRKIDIKEWLEFAKNEVPRLDAGQYKNRSISEAIRSSRDIQPIERHQRAVSKRKLQVPSLIDFSRNNSGISVSEF